MRKAIVFLAALGVLGVAASTGLAMGISASASGTGSTVPAEASAPATQLTGCSANRICVYGLTNFEDEVQGYDCAFSGRFSAGGNLLSARNRCGNKTNWLQEGATTIACMNPGGDRPSPGAFDHVFIAAEYGAFC
jgi:hypothetical protein